MTVEAECWLCDGCGEVETYKADGTPVTVGCPACVQRDHEALRRRVEIERDEVEAELRKARADHREAIYYLGEARADERQAMHYLEQIRQIMGHDGDFPSLVVAIAELCNQRNQCDE